MSTTGAHRMAASRHFRTIFDSGAIGSLPDRQLLERFLAGRGDEDSAAAFAALVERHGPMVLSVCRRALGHLQDAEDAAQATFLVLARRGGSIRRADSLASWLFGVALKVATKARARSARRRAVEREGVEMRAQAVGSGPSTVDRSELYEALDRLPDRLRAPIVLCHLEGLSNEQAASQLGLPLRTVQRRLAQGRERLRSRLAGIGLAPAFAVVEAAPEAWIEATARAAAGLAAGRPVAAVASAPVAAMVRGAIAASRLKAAAIGVVLVGSLAALAGAGARLAAGSRPDPPAPRPAQGAAPPVARVGPWIRGLVVDEQGRPVAGARVSSLWAVEPRAVMTKADGTFALPTDEPRLANQSLLATADNGARQGIFRFDGPSGYRGPRTVPRVVLRPTSEINVTVVDGRRAPVPDAEVFALDLVFPVARGKTDAQGAARLRVPADSWVQWIVAAKPGVGFDYFENYRAVPAVPWSPPPRAARLVLDGARTARIRVVDAGGRPVPGVELYPITIQKKGKLRSVNLSPLPIDARSDANGVATFEWLPADLLPGTTFFGASPAYDLPEPPVLDPAKLGVELSARVLRRTRISGKVTRPDGSPASGIRVFAQGIGGGREMAGSALVRTVADGSYATEVAPEQSYLIGVIDDEWAARSRGGIVVREGVPRAGLDLTLERGGVVRGRVTAGPGSTPSAGQSVMLTEQGPAVPPGLFKDQQPGLIHWFQRVVDTDEDGRYAFRVGPGTYQLTGPRGPGDRPASIHLTVAPGQEIERDFHLPRERNPFRTLRGVVRAGSADGPPIADAVLTLQPIEIREPPAEGYADEHGRFVLPRLDGRVILYARSPAGDLAGLAVIDDDRERTLVARPAVAARGRVVDQDGRPLASVHVGCLVEAGLPAVGRDGPPGAVQSVLTDADGRFTAVGLPVGATCRFRAWISGARDVPTHRLSISEARPVEVPPLVITRPAATPGPR